MKIFILLLVSLSFYASNAKAENCIAGKTKSSSNLHKEPSSKAGRSSHFPYVELGEGKFFFGSRGGALHLKKNSTILLCGNKLYSGKFAKVKIANNAVWYSKHGRHIAIPNNRLNEFASPSGEKINVPEYLYIPASNTNFFIKDNGVFPDEKSYIKAKEEPSKLKTYKDFLAFYNKHSANALIKNAGLGAYKTVDKNSIKYNVSYVNDFNISPPHEVYKNIYKLVLDNKNIAGLQWFIDEYPKSEKSRNALQNIYKIAFEEAKSIHTIEAYNDFIVAYPYAEQVQEAQNEAYDLEENVYSGWLSWFSSDEKNSRALLVKSKQLERKMQDADTKARDGYRLVIDRMNKLLQDKFPAEEATLRYLESEEFKDFYRDLKKSLASIEDTLKRIDSNTSDLNSTLQNQSRMMDSHFRKAAQSKEMAAKYTEQHRFWERYMRDQGV